MTRNRRAAPGRTAVGYFMPFSECRRRQPRGPGAAAEAAAKAEEERKAAEAAAKAEEERKAAAKAEEEKKTAGLVKVRAKNRFLDKELNQIKDTGDTYTVTRERAAVLVNAGVAEETE